MKLTGFRFLCCCWELFLSSVIPPASGKPLGTGPPEPVVAVAGKDVILPSHVTTLVAHSRDMTVEWTRVDGPTTLTVNVLREGVELVREKAPEYRGRTELLEDCSLKLLRVQERDQGTYRCVIFRGSSVENTVSVSLTVAKVSEVNLSVRRTEADELFVHCESSGWSPEPKASLLDFRRSIVAAEHKSSVRPDGLFTVRVFVNLTAVAETLTENGTLICQVEIPGMSLLKENKISVNDEFKPQQAAHCNKMYYFLFGVFFVVVVVVVILIVVVVLKRESLLQFWRGQRSHQPVPSDQSSEQSVPLVQISDQPVPPAQISDQPVPPAQISDQPVPPAQISDQPLLSAQPEFTEYGDVSKVETTGASDFTAKSNGLSTRNIEASNELAEKDLNNMLEYKGIITSVGAKLRVHPALIAGIISRQSQAGKSLKTNGFGKSDSDCYGLMQINRHYHAVKGNAFDEDHVDQGVTFLIQLIKTMVRTKKHWSKEQQLKGALACYIAGEERVLPLEYHQLDTVTPGGDFANDVIARAKWFARLLHDGSCHFPPGFE